MNGTAKIGDTCFIEIKWKMSDVNSIKTSLQGQLSNFVRLEGFSTKVNKSPIGNSSNMDCTDEEGKLGEHFIDTYNVIIDHKFHNAKVSVKFSIHPKHWMEMVLIHSKRPNIEKTFNVFTLSDHQMGMNIGQMYRNHSLILMEIHGSNVNDSTLKQLSFDLLFQLVSPVQQKAQSFHSDKLIDPFCFVIYKNALAFCVIGIIRFSFR